MIIGITATLKETIPTHDHELHEFIISLNDGCEARVAEQRYRLKTGFTLFIPGGVAHGIVIDRECSAVLSFTCFDWQSCTEHLHKSIEPLINRLSSEVSLADTYDSQVGSRNLFLAEQLKHELERKDPCSQSMAGSILTQLLVNHIRALGLHTDGVNSRNEQKIAFSIEWIKNHLSENIKLDDMARSAHMSRSLYSRSFRLYTGMSLISFTIAARVERAARLLAQGDETIVNIALSSGFQNVSHFHKAFKRRFRMTPNQYRQAIVKQEAPRRRLNLVAS